LKLNEIHSWFIIQLNFLKILFQSSQTIDKKYWFCIEYLFVWLLSFE